MKKPNPIMHYFNSHPKETRIFFGVIFGCIILYACIHVYRVSSLPTDENIFHDSNKGLMIFDVTKGGASDLAGLHVGDIITKINNQSFTNARQADSILRRGQIGKEIDYTILRDGKESVFKVRLAQFGIPLVYLFQLILGIVLLSVSLFVVLMRPTYQIARLLSMSFMFIGLYFLIASNVPAYIFTDVLNRIWPLLFLSSFPVGFVMLAHASLYFPVRRNNINYPRWFFYLIYGMAVVYILIGLLLFRGPSLFFEIGLLVILIVSFILPIFIFKNNFNPEYKLKNKFNMIALCIAGGIFLLNLLLGILKIEIVARQYLIVLLNILPVMYAYTIIKYRIFDIYLVIRKSLIYTMLTWIVMAAFVVSVMLIINSLPLLKLNLPAVRFTERTVEIANLDQLPEVERTQIEKSMLISFGIALTLLLWQVQKRGKVLLERKFYREKYDYKKALLHFSKLSARVTDKDVLAREVVQKISDIMHIKGAALAFINDGSFSIRESTGLNQDCCKTITLNSHDSWAQELYHLRTSQAADNLNTNEIFKGTGIQFLTPVVVHERLEGVILLGEKYSETNYTKDDIELLDSISHQVAAAIETMRLYEEVSEKERMKRELEIARRIQLSSLPSETPEIPGLDIAAISKPALEVGGDFYDFLVRHDEATFILGDVSGKGTSAALYMSRVQGIIRSLDSYQPSLWELFVRLNNQVYGHIERNSYVTVIGVRINLLNHHASFIRAGHLPLIHYHADSNSIEVYQPQGLGVGLDERQFSATLVEQKIHPETGDVILLFSDGLTEAHNIRDEEYGVEHLQKILLQHAHHSAEEIKDSIIKSIDRFVDTAHQHDDITLVVIKMV